MITQQEIDQLKKDLEDLRKVLLRDREAVRAQIQPLIAKAQRMRADGAGGKFEPAICSVHDLLIAVQRGLTAQANLKSSFES
ncbi:MAG: hypothetical protein IT443_13115 [Phycisphaeraceae bacterium]|nr:hypothetical protein [Phycisphaeraceae bacterium]